MKQEQGRRASAGNWVELPADIADEWHPNIMVVPMPRDANIALEGYFNTLLMIREDCPACEHSPHPTDARREQLISMPYKDYLWTPEWRRTRRAALHRADYRCRRCQKRNAVHVHHLVYDHIGHEWLDELVALCEPCHRALHEERDQHRQARKRRR
jgi:hypothetical protein